MLRRSQGAPLHQIDHEINRTLRQIHRLYQDEGRGLCYIVNSESDTYSSSSPSGSMAGQENNVWFREFGNPEDYEFTGGILLPVTETNFSIHPQYTRMVQSEKFSGSAS